MLILVALGILGFKHASIDLQKVTLWSASLSFLVVIILTGYVHTVTSRQNEMS